MAPKRGIRDKFLTCHVCKTTFYESAEFHQNHCIAMQKRHSTQGFQADDFSFKQDYLYNGILYGRVQESKQSSKDILTEKKAVLMHPSTMKLCKIHIYGYVIVQSYDNHNLYVVYPSSNVHKTAIAFVDSRQRKYKFKEKVKVSPYYGKVLDAERVLISLISMEDIYGDDFNNFLKQELGNTYIYSGMSIHNVYEGSPFELLIKEANPLLLSSVSNSRAVVKDEYISSLNANFSLLTLNDSKLNETKFHTALESSILDSSCDTPSFYSSSAVSMSDKSLNSFESSTLNFMREFYIHPDINQYFNFTSMTLITIESNEKMIESVEENFETMFKDIGGLKEQKKTIKDYLELFFEDDCISVGLPHGMLLYGPSGVGKTLLAEAIANEMKVNFIKITATDIYLKHYLSTENQIKHTFKNAIEKCPCVVFIDELDHLCDMFQNDRSGIISTLEYYMHEILVSQIKVFVIAAATSITAIDDSLLKTGHFEIEVKFENPDTDEKKEILSIALSSRKHNLTEREVCEIAKFSHGFTGSDLTRIFKEAEFEKLQRYSEQDADASKFRIDFAYMERKLKEIKPHILNTDQYSFQKVHWEDIGGMEKVKTKIRHVVEFPLLYPQVFKRYAITPSCGILLYGPPGCSKTMIAKALATESHLNFIPIKGAELFSKWVGDSEKAVRDLFKQAKEAAPCIIFFDEIDSLATDRGSSEGSNVHKNVVTQLLTEIDGAEQLAGVVVVAATNRPDRLDPGMLRPGRLDHLIYIPLPDVETRKAIFNLKFKKLSIGNVDIKELVKKTSGYTGAELIAICHEAGLLAMSENFPEVVANACIQEHHFEEAIKIVKPRITVEVIEFYKTFNSNY